MFLCKQNKTYHLRVMVPLPLVSLVGKKELRFTLKTTDRKVALKLAKVLTERIQAVFNQLTLSKLEVNLMIKTGRLTQAEVHRLIRRYVLDEFEEIKANVLLNAEISTALSPERESLNGSESLEFDLFESRLSLEREQFTQHMGPVLDQLAIQMGMELDRDSAQYKLICRELLKANISLLEANMSQLMDDSQPANPQAVLDDLGIEDEPEPPSPEPRSSPDARVTAELPEPMAPRSSPDARSSAKHPSIRLSDLIREYQDRQLQAKRWSEVTLRNHAPKFNALVQYLGDRPVNTITIDDMRGYSKLLEVLPRGFARLAEYQDIAGLSPNAVKGAQHGLPLVDPTTRREYLNLARSLLTYALENQYVDSNPVISGIIPPKKKQARSQRDAFVSFRQARVKRFNQPVTIGGQKSIGGAIDGTTGTIRIN